MVIVSCWGVLPSCAVHKTHRFCCVCREAETPQNALEWSVLVRWTMSLVVVVSGDAEFCNRVELGVEVRGVWGGGGGARGAGWRWGCYTLDGASLRSVDGLCVREGGREGGSE